MARYIIEIEDVPSMLEDGRAFYKCVNAPWWYISEDVIKNRLKPYEDVKPVVHGKWVELYNYYYDNAYGCSVCGAQFIMIECTPQDNLWKFCPNCGSDMRQ